MTGILLKKDTLYRDHVMGLLLKQDLVLSLLLVLGYDLVTVILASQSICVESCWCGECECE